MEPTLAQRRSRALATGAFLLLVTALWLDWWVVRATSTVTVEWGYRLFKGGEGAHRWAALSTGLLVAAVSLWLFIRVAGNSVEHEPAAWRRDLVGQTVASAVAATSLWWFPTDLPVWQRWTESLNDTTSSDLVVRTLPGLGWWCVVLATLLLGVAMFMARDTTDK